MTYDITILSTGKVSLLEDRESPLVETIREHKEEIDRLWDKSIQTHGKTLFNAPLCFFSGLVQQESSDFLRVVRGEYKDYMAQRSGLEMGLVPVGVSGVLTSLFRGRLYCVLARRAHSVTQYPGALEFVPSGGLNEDAFTQGRNVEPLRVLFSEFEEELGMSREHIHRAEPLGVVKDCTERVIDVCFLLCSSIAPSELKDAMSISTEYEESLFLPVDEAISMLETLPQESVVPTSVALAQLLRAAPLSSYYESMGR